CDSLVCCGRRYADRAIRWRWSVEFGAVFGRLSLRRAAVVSRSVLRGKPRRQAAGRQTAALLLSGIGGDLLLFRGVRDRFRLQRVRRIGRRRAVALAVNVRNGSGFLYSQPNPLFRSEESRHG